MLNSSILLPTDDEATVKKYRFSSLIITARSVFGRKNLWHEPLTFDSFSHITLIICAVYGENDIQRARHQVPMTRPGAVPVIMKRDKRGMNTVSALFSRFNISFQIHDR